MTYSELAAAIQDWAENDEANFVANIPTIVRKAENRISTAVRVPDSKKSFSDNLVVGTATVPAPTGMLYVNEFMVTLSTGARFLKRRDLSYLREAFPLLVNGSPEYYAFADDDTLTICPPPAGTYPYTIEYMAMPQSIVDLETTWLGDNASSVLLDACLIEAAVFMKQPPEEIIAMEGLLKEKLMDLRVIREGRVLKDTYRKPDTRMEV